MKTFTIIPVLAILAASCQKEVAQQQHISTQTIDQAVTKEDTIYFYGWAASSNGGQAFSGSYSPIFIDNFTVPHDTGYYFKKAVFKITKSSGVKISRARLFIDDNRNTVRMTADSAVFNYAVPVRLRPVHPNTVEHWVNMQVLATATVNDWVQVRLRYVIVIKKYPKPQLQVPTKGLPEVGAVYNY